MDQSSGLLADRAPQDNSALSSQGIVHSCAGCAGVVINGTLTLGLSNTSQEGPEENKRAYTDLVRKLSVMYVVFSISFELLSVLIF